MFPHKCLQIQTHTVQNKLVQSMNHFSSNFDHNCHQYFDFCTKRYKNMTYLKNGGLWRHVVSSEICGMSVWLQQKFAVEAVSGGCKLDPKFAVQSNRPQPTDHWLENQLYHRNQHEKGFNSIYISPQFNKVNSSKIKKRKTVRSDTMADRIFWLMMSQPHQRLKCPDVGSRQQRNCQKIDHLLATKTNITRPIQMGFKRPLIWYIDRLDMCSESRDLDGFKMALRELPCHSRGCGHTWQTWPTWKKSSQIVSKPYHKDSPSDTLQESVIKVEIGWETKKLKTHFLHFEKF